MATYSLNRTLWMLHELNMSRCTRCKLWRPAEMFMERATRANGLDTWCRTCRAEHMAGPSICGTPGWTRRRATNLLYKYKMTPQEWEDRFAAQGYGCYLCGTQETPQWMVDHNHDCCAGRQATCGDCVMGIACQECNTLEAALQRLIDRGGETGLQKVLRRAQGIR